MRTAVFGIAIFTSLFALPDTEIVSANESSVTRTVSGTTAVTAKTAGQLAQNAPSPTMPTATLVVGHAEPKHAGDLFPLEISVHNLTGGGFAILSGFADGTTLNSGSQLGDNQWWVPVAELEHLVVKPPQPGLYIGEMDITIELRLADTRLSDKKSLHLEWAPLATLDPDEIAVLLSRGNELIASGDLAAAQLVLRRAAEGGSAAAAVRLAGTYDPTLVAKIGARGFIPDIAQARLWYEKAKQLGSVEAVRRLELMAIKRD